MTKQPDPPAEAKRWFKSIYTGQISSAEELEYTTVDTGELIEVTESGEPVAALKRPSSPELDAVVNDYALACVNEQLARGLQPADDKLIQACLASVIEKRDAIRALFNAEQQKAKDWQSIANQLQDKLAAAALREGGDG